MARTRHVIVGGGTAGINAITTIRQYDRGASEIMLVSAERPYARMVLPYYLKGSISESHVYTLNPTRLHTLDVEAYLGRRAAHLGGGVAPHWLGGRAPGRLCRRAATVRGTGHGHRAERQAAGLPRLR